MSSRLIVAAAAAVALLSVKPASAATLVFGSFSYVGPTTVSYDNSTGSLTGFSVPIAFNYVSGASGVVGTPATGYGPQAATLTFSANRLGNVATGFGQGAQEMALTAFSITRDTPFGGKSNLLSGSATKSVLHGTLGGSVANLEGSMSAGATIVYTSDFLTFPPPTDADFSWAMQSVSPPLAISGTNFRSFNASIAGTFGYNGRPSSVPEGSSLALLTVGLVPVGMLLRKRRSPK